MNRRLFATAIVSAAARGQQKKLRLAVAGLAHGHATGFLRSLLARQDVELAGVSDPDASLHKLYGERFKLSPALFHASHGKMMDATKPDAVGTFTSTFDHVAVVRECAARKLPVMMEKPLAVSNEHAREIATLARKAGIPVVVNYETTWYRSHAAIWQWIKKEAAAGPIRKMVAMDGHQGPREIGVGDEFFSWLTDPVKNGAGALFDFGCYGANLMTWLMDDQRPLTVTARVQQIKPHIYPKVDDEANVLVEYPKAIGLIEGSWNWPYSRKDLEVYTEKGYAHAIGGNAVKMRRPGAKAEESLTPAELPAAERDPVSYLAAIVRGEIRPGGLSSLENNLIATEILVAARESARTGRTVKLG